MPLHAALLYEISTEVEREDVIERFSERVMIDGDEGRIDFLDAAGEPDGGYVEDLWMTTAIEMPAMEGQYLRDGAHTGFAYADELSTK